MKLILKYVVVTCPDVTASSIYITAVWDDAEVKLHYLVTMGHEQAMHMLPAWMVAFKTLKNQEQTQLVSSADAASPLPYSDSA